MSLRAGRSSRRGHDTRSGSVGYDLAFRAPGRRLTVLEKQIASSPGSFCERALAPRNDNGYSPSCSFVVEAMFSPIKPALGDLRFASEIIDPKFHVRLMPSSRSLAPLLVWGISAVDCSRTKRRNTLTTTSFRNCASVRIIDMEGCGNGNHRHHSDTLQSK